MAISAQRIEAHLASITQATNAYDKARAHEDLAVHLFDSVPGCRVERTIIKDFQTEEVDVAVGNNRVPGGLPGLPSVLLVECKGWSRPVNSQAVGSFVNKLAERSVELGILIATQGIAGQRKNRYAVALGMGAVARGIKLFVITRDDIMALSTTADFVELLYRRYLRAVAAGTIGLPS